MRFIDCGYVILHSEIRCKHVSEMIGSAICLWILFLFVLRKNSSIWYWNFEQFMKYISYMVSNLTKHKHAPTFFFAENNNWKVVFN